MVLWKSPQNPKFNCLITPKTRLVWPLLLMLDTYRFTMDQTWRFLVCKFIPEKPEKEWIFFRNENSPKKIYFFSVFSGMKSYVWNNAGFLAFSWMKFHIRKRHVWSIIQIRRCHNCMPFDILWLIGCWTITPPPIPKLLFFKWDSTDQLFDSAGQPPLWSIFWFFPKFVVTVYQTCVRDSVT